MAVQHSPGEGKSRTYRLCGYFTIDAVRSGGRQGFRTLVEDSSGQLLRPMPQIDGEPWFPQRFLARMRQPALEAYRVSRAIKDVARDDYTLLEPVETDEEPAFDMDEEDEDDERD